MYLGFVFLRPLGLRSDVTFTFTSADGLFAETFAIPLLAGSHGFDEEPGPVGPGFYFSLDMDAHQGTLSLDDFTFADAEIRDLVLSGSFDAEGLGGSLSMEVETMDWVGFGAVASFSAAPQP